MNTQVKPIRTEQEYEDAVEEIERLSDAVPETPEGDYLGVLMILVEDYEERHYPVPPPDPIEAIEYYMESRGLSRKDLEPYIGGRGRVSEILNRRRPLTLRMSRGRIGRSRPTLTTVLPVRPSQLRPCILSRTGASSGAVALSESHVTLAAYP
jgi:HTH-type transcriptional regulator/antitoxin HigA